MAHATPASLRTPVSSQLSSVKRTLFADTKMDVDKAAGDDVSDDSSPPPSPTHSALLRERGVKQSRGGGPLSAKAGALFSTPLFENEDDLLDPHDSRSHGAAVRHLLTAQQTAPMPTVAICPPSPVKPSPFALHTPSLNNTNPFSPKPNRSINHTTTMPPPHPREPTSSTSTAASTITASHACSAYKQDFEEMRIIGTGSYGRVVMAKNKIDGAIYAVKKGLRPVRNLHSLNEAFALAALGSHANIVRYYRAWIEDTHLYIQMEYCEAGSLAAWLKLHGNEFTQKQILNIARQVLCGLKHIHDKHMAHLDIKPDNIFMVKNEQNKITYKIGDFGLTSLTDLSGRANGEISEGDSKYLAPELLQTTQDRRQLLKADIYSLGRSLFELALGRPLQPETERAEISLPADRFTAEFVELLASMMRPDPQRRPSAAELLRHFLLRTKSHQQLTRKCIEVRRLHREMRDAKARHMELAMQLERQKEANRQLQEDKAAYKDIIFRMIEQSHYNAPLQPMEATTTSPQK